jgi:hypothetical protein
MVLNSGTSMGTGTDSVNGGGSNPRCGRNNSDWGRVELGRVVSTQALFFLGLLFLLLAFFSFRRLGDRRHGKDEEYPRSKQGV